jgi:hypothetical protein
MALLRFLQISDLHLGRPFQFLTPDRRALRRRDQHAALERVVALAIEREAQALLVPGDLFDTVPVDAGEITFLVHAFAVPNCPPVFIAPGNHDPASRDNAAFHETLRASRGTAWPSHVHVFTSPEWSAVPLDTADGVRIWGRAFLSSSGTMDRPLGADAVRALGAGGAGMVDVAVFHGSREGSCPTAQIITAPFSDAEVLASPFAYHAVGHYHARSEVTQPAGVAGPASGTRLAYAGSPVALDHGETGVHGALEVQMRVEDGACHVRVESIPLDRRRMHETRADVSDCSTPEAVDRRILHAFAAAGVTRDDFADLRLTGRLMPGVRWTKPGPEVFEAAFHVRWDRSAVRPEHDLAALRQSDGRTTEQRFAKELLQRFDAETDPEQRAHLERALYYGLDAFRLREVMPMWEEVSE